MQTEITYAMRVAEKFGFRFNTFTHILEGYKVADKMKVHGANASTFSDWWNYKIEVIDAIPQNAAIMQRVGLNVAINSDDAEMARRLNQEAAKSIKYGGMSEEDALKMVTINPAKMLHVDNKVGSIKVGKDADLVLWTDNPLSIYAKAQTTIVDGIVEFDMGRDMQLRQKIKEERNRLIQKIIGEKKSGARWYRECRRQKYCCIVKKKKPFQALRRKIINNKKIKFHIMKKYIQYFIALILFRKCAKHRKQFILHQNKKELFI